MNSVDPVATSFEVADVQALAPNISLSLSRVGVTGVEKIIRLRQNGSESLFSTEIECFVDLGPDQKGAHMSRFEEVTNETIGEVVLGSDTFRADELAARIASLVRERQGALRAECRIRARYPEHKPAPVSGVQTQEISTLHGVAVASQNLERRVLGVTAQGLTACPCAQQLVAGEARSDLITAGYSTEQIDEILEIVPVATHNQRGLGTLYLGTTSGTEQQIDVEPLLAIVEDAMSSEIYELMKRSDEAAVVTKAHRRPRFVEDCIREMIGGVLAKYTELDGSTFVFARQENLETIHQHNVVSERYGLLSELRDELATGKHTQSHTTLREWLEGA